MKAVEVRQRFLDFFEKRGHTVIPSASLVPQNDPSVLFNTAGMQPLVPYLLGQAHPSGSTRFVDSQKCVRTNDIDEVGDNTHLTFFEMLGNWSLGDYFKEDAIAWSYEFLISKEEGLGLDPKCLYVTVFAGNENASRDDDAHNTWKRIFENAGLDPEKRIFFMGADTNWWSPGDNGPCGPDSEMFYDVSGILTDGLTKEEFIAADNRQDLVEIWNDVFMEYEKKDGEVVGKLAKKNVDTGSGLERIVAVVQGKNSVFATDLFTSILDKIAEHSTHGDPRAARIIADHIRAAVFLISDGVTPSNTDQGYILRRLLRRAIRYADTLGIPEGKLSELVAVIAREYGDAYPELREKEVHIAQTISDEEGKFRKTLEKGLKMFEKFALRNTYNLGEDVQKDKVVTGETAFALVTTHGFPFELIEEIAHEKGLVVDKVEFKALMEKHRAKSSAGAAQKFKGGLADAGEETTMLHTCTHLMLAGLRKYLGDHVHQAGSNITPERTRFDFTHPEKVSREVLNQVEDYVNEAIEKGATVTIEQMPKDEAQKRGVEGSFWEKYPDVVNVYTVKADDGTVYSQELCGGPHVETTGVIRNTGKRFKIIKEESSSAGVRRIKATLS